MRRILCKIPRRPTPFVSSFCAAAADGGRATIAATFPTAGDGGFLPTIVRTPHTKPPTDSFGVFVGQSAWARKQLKNEVRGRKALGILSRNYGGRAIQDDESDEEKVAKTNTRKVPEEELDLFLTNFSIECETGHLNYAFFREHFYILIEEMNQEDELGDGTQNDRVDKLAEIAETLVTNSFTANLMFACEPKYGKRFCEIIEKVRKKMIQDDGILQAFELVTNLMSRCEPEYEKLLCEVLEKITQGGIDEILDMDIEKFDMYKTKLEEGSFEDALVMENLQSNLMHIEIKKPRFMAYEVIEKVAEKAGNENIRKIAERKLDKIVMDTFVSEALNVQMDIPHCRFLRFEHEVYGGKAIQDDESDEEEVAKTNVLEVSEEEPDVFLTNLAIECGSDHEKYEFIRQGYLNCLEEMNEDVELGDGTLNDRVDKLAEIAEAFVTNSFTANLMIECEPKYEKRFCEIIERVRKKMIQDDGVLRAFEFVTNLSRCEPEYEKLLCEVLEKVREKITQNDRDAKGGNENIHKKEKLTKLDILAELDMKAGSFEKKLVEFVVTERFPVIFWEVEVMKPYFMAYEVIEKVAMKVGNENVRKMAEGHLDKIVMDTFTYETMVVCSKVPFFMSLRLVPEDEDVF